MWRSTVAAASWVLRGSSEWGGNGVWHVDSGVNPPGLLKRLLLEFNHPAILDTLWSWEGWLMSKQHANCKHQLIQKVQSTLRMDECNSMMRKQNKLWKSNVTLLFSTFHASYCIKNWLALAFEQLVCEATKLYLKMILEWAVQVTCPPSYILLPRISQGLRDSVLNFSASEALSFHYAELIFTQRPHSFVCKSKRQSTSELFQGNLHNA